MDARIAAEAAKLVNTHSHAGNLRALMFVFFLRIFHIAAFFVTEKNEQPEPIH